jgi:peptidoglycan hydrolase-like protein with peptidoglycan-binding domain
MPAWFSRPLSLGDEGDDVKIVQRKVQAQITGTYDEPTAARVRGVQRKMGKKQTGVVDADTAADLGEKPDAGQVPGWFGQPGQDDRVREILRLSNIEPLDSAVRRFQSDLGMELTGEVDEKVAVAIADRSF